MTDLQINKEMVAKLAVEFSRVLRSWLSDEEMQTINERNLAYRAANDLLVCASHDFCDANMAMLEACNTLGLPNPLDCDLDMVTQAWDMAKANGFAIPDEFHEPDLNDIATRLVALGHEASNHNSGGNIRGILIKKDAYTFFFGTGETIWMADFCKAETAEYITYVITETLTSCTNYDAVARAIAHAVDAFEIDAAIARYEEDERKANETEMVDVLNQATAAFWQVVARRYSNATSGDLSPNATLEFDRVATNAIAEWVSNNVPKE